MSEKVTADEMQDANNTIIESEGVIRTLGKMLYMNMGNAPDKVYGEYEVTPQDAEQMAAIALMMIADKLESAIVTTDNAHFYGCAGTLEGDAAE